MTQRRYIDGHEHALCHACEQWHRVEFVTRYLLRGEPERGVCDSCVEKEERDEAAESYWNSRSWEDRV